MMPKAGVFKRSEVFQVLNDEQLKSKVEEPVDQTHWTTFLQKPKRPPPQPRHNQVITNTYKPLIVKQPKPKCAPDYRVTPSPVSCHLIYPQNPHDHHGLFSRNQFKFSKSKNSSAMRSSKKKSFKFKSKSRPKSSRKHHTWPPQPPPPRR
jgi:hypothetical protein